MSCSLVHTFLRRRDKNDYGDEGNDDDETSRMTYTQKTDRLDILGSDFKHEQEQTRSRK